MIYMTAILAMATILYTLIYRSQVKFMKENARQTAEQTDRLVAASERLAETTKSTLEEAKRVNKETADRADRTTRAIETQANASMSQANTSKVTAEAAKESAKTARRSFEFGQRPELFFVLVKLREPLTVGQAPVVQFVLTNGGSMAAKGQFWDITWRTTPVPFIGGLEYNARGTKVTFSLASHATNTMTFSTTFIPTKEQVEALDAGNRLLFIYARGEYTDTLGRRYPMPFCYSYNKDIAERVAICPDDIPIKQE